MQSFSRITGIVILSLTSMHLWGQHLNHMQNARTDDAAAGHENWQQILENDLNLLGHRNWILLVDKAFPEQSSQGMKYLFVDQDLLPILDYVLERVQSSTHVSPIIYRDKELDYLTDDMAPGIESFRKSSNKILSGLEIQSLWHDDVFALLDESSALFRTLVIKTSCILPYTSVFIQLDCSYWKPENEKILRNKINQDTKL